MPISSRTPEGWPNRCPVCGADLRIDPSQSSGDAPCPRCGHLLWFDPSDLRRRVLEEVAAKLHRDPDALDLDSPLDNLGLDSLDLAELMMELVETLEVTLSDDDLLAERWQTLRDLIEQIIRTRLRENPED